jgi:hypothetical protein
MTHNAPQLEDLKNRIEGLFKNKYKDRLGLNLKLNVYRMKMGLTNNNNESNGPLYTSNVVIDFNYGTVAGPSFVYDVSTKKISIFRDGDVLFESTRRHTSPDTYHTINTASMSINQKTAFLTKIRRECNRVYYRRSRSRSRSYGGTRRAGRR